MAIRMVFIYIIGVNSNDDNLFNSFIFYLFFYFYLLSFYK